MLLQVHQLMQLKRIVYNCCVDYTSKYHTEKNYLIKAA